MENPLSVLFTRITTISLAIGLIAALMQPSWAADTEEPKFMRIPTQFIAALGDPEASSGSGAQSWRLWRIDPGPRGVWLKDYTKLEASGGVAPTKWQFDKDEWWVDENGILMEKPEFAVPPGKYVVTGDRETISVLTIHPADATGEMRWELDFGAKLYDVTHLPCRSASYTPASSGTSCSPLMARKADFPVEPGGIMPAVEGCNKQDYSVLFVIGVEVEDS